MAKRLISLSGKVKRILASELDADRYQYLSLEQAEPNPGNPDSNNSLFMSNADGTRKFVREPELGGLSFTNAKLPNYDNVVVDGTYALILNNDPNSHDFADSVGYRKLTAAAFTPPTLQTVTTTGNTTDRGIIITNSLDPSTGSGLVITASDALNVSGTSLFSNDLTISSGSTLFYNAPPLLDNTILTIGDNDSVGQREALFAFVAPTLQNVTDRSIAVDGGDNAVTTDGLKAAFFKMSDAPTSRASVDARTALVFTGIDDSIGTRTLRDLAVADSTSSAIRVNNNFTANKLYVQDPSTFTLPASGTIPLVVYTDDSEYAIVDIDVENLDANFETLLSVTARQAPGLDFGETTNEAIFSGELRLRNTTVNTGTISRQVLIGETTGVDSAVVRRREATYLAFGDSTDSQITMHGLISKGDISSTTKVTVPDLTLTGLSAQAGEFTALTINGSNVVGTNEMVDVATTQTITGTKSIANDIALGFNGSASTNTITRAANDTWRFNYSDQSIIFDAANNNTFEIRNNNDSAIFQMDPNGGAGDASRLNLMGDIKVETLGVTTTEATSVMIDTNGVFLSRELSTSAFTDPGLDDVTAIDPTTTDQITTGGIVTTGPSSFTDSVRFADPILGQVNFTDSVFADGNFYLPNIPASTSLRVLVKNTADDQVAYQDISQEAFSGETLHTATSQGQATSNNVGAASFWVYDGTGFNDNDSLAEFVRVIDSARDFYVQDKVFFNDNHAANPTNDGDRNFIRFTDPAFQGYPGIYDFISDDSDDASSVGNALLRAGGLILTDSALVGGNLTITGNLTVNGTRTIINTTQLTIDDKTIVIADNAPDEVSTAGAGLYVTDSVNPYAKFTYDGAGSWVSNKNLTIDSDLIVSGATLLDGNFNGDGGLSLLGAVELSTEATALMLGANDSVGYRELSSGAFTNIDNVTWNFVLGKGRFSGNEVPYIQAGLQIDSTGLKPDQGGTRIITLIGDQDSVGVSSIQSTAYEPLANFNLQFVTNRGASTDKRVTINDLMISTAKDFDASANNTQLALHYDNGTDSVGYRDLGSLAYLDSDGETFKSITEKGNAVNTSLANIKVNGLMIDSARAMSGITVGMMYKSSTDSVGVRALSDAAFLDPGLTEVLAQNDSTKLSATFGGLILPKHGTPVAGSPNVLVPGDADFFQMLIINQDNDSVSRGDIGTIVQTVSQETLQSVTSRGAALNNSSWDSSTVGIDLSGGLKLRNLPETSGDSVLVANTNGTVAYRKLSDLQAAINLNTVVTNGPTTDKEIGVKELYIYDGSGFTAGTDAVATNHVLTIDENRNAFFANLDATGLTTLDSTTIDGDLQVSLNLNVDGLTTLDSTTIDGRLTANGGIDGLSQTGGISGDNFNITGVNQLVIADPGEGVIFTGNTSGNITLAVVDDTSDNILQVIGSANTIFQVPNFDATGTTTLDSTAIDAGVNGDGLTIPNLGEVTTNTDILTINGDVVSKTAFSDIYTVPPTPTLQSVTDVGSTTTNDIEISDNYLSIINTDGSYAFRANVGVDTFKVNNISPVISKTGIVGDDATTGALQIHRHGANALGPYLFLSKNRGTDLLDPVIVASGDRLGTIAFGGNDGTVASIPGAEINVIAEGTQGAGDIAATMNFYNYSSGVKTQTMSVALDSVRVDGQFSVFHDTVGSEVLINSTSQIPIQIHNNKTVAWDAAGYKSVIETKMFSTDTIIHKHFINTLDASGGAGDTVTYNSQLYDIGGTIQSYSFQTESTFGFDIGGLKMSLDANKMQLQTGVQLQDAAGTNLVIYDSAGDVLWGNV